MESYDRSRPKVTRDMQEYITFRVCIFSVTFMKVNVLSNLFIFFSKSVYICSSIKLHVSHKKGSTQNKII